ncbi:unnamed protein product [Didymodactylos carnosus]|uniref:EGF-like domain-containing protein n=1 Tax=Didymodactylos carnosus TaxID=1234261 RepID=A0A8S2IHH6_9BILA|nr:unnamed protein product [Didymodactylos carnosus]CAF3755176.1 unnamed protein product [Didymodactylos carnosus]
MVYRNANDGNMVIRRCCTSGCGEDGKTSEFEGREAYFCTSNLCNATQSTSTSTITTATTTVQTSLACYDCSGFNEQCGTESTLISNCRSCMVYRNPVDQTKIERHCCYWNCGSSGTITEYDGRPTYFCSNDRCNGIGVESLLEPTGFSEQCGTESTLISNCRSCMVYRNPVDQTKIERHCCYWNCGTPGSVSEYDGRPTYFCTNDKCNGIGAEYNLGSPATTSTTTTASLIGPCILNCKNGGTLETVDGCYCYCVENTSGKECETIDCSKQDENDEACNVGNKPLCYESEIFVLECRHLCELC